jgi:putative thioredoxin
MMAHDNIINVTENDFEYNVLAYSQQVPVVVDFWAEWCVPCKVLGPILERLAQEADGNFRLAKVNVDNNPNLAYRYEIRSIPAVRAFRDGRMVAEFTGAQPEHKVREFIRKIVPSQDDLEIEKGLSLLQAKRTYEAENSFRNVLEHDNRNPKALLGVAKCLLLMGYPDEAKEILSNFPASQEIAAAETLRPLAEVASRILNRRDEEDADPLNTLFNSAVRLAMNNNIPAALDGLLDLLRQNKRFRNGEARVVFLALLEILGENDPLNRQYRNELAAVLF